MNNTAKTALRRGLTALGLLAFSAGFVLIFSISTSFRYPGFGGGDSAIFQAVGRGWSQGLLPYGQMFDHKGPLIFFINALGYAVRGRAGLMLFQTVSLAAAIWFIYQMGRVYLNRPFSVLAAASSVLYIARTFDEGNMTEEYSLPFIAASLWLLLRWCRRVQTDGPADHPWQWAAVYGLSFGAILMMRVTNAVSFCCFVAVVCVYLVIWGRWKNLGQNALGFVGGFLGITAPFGIYFAAKGLFDEMLYGTLIYNVRYTGEFSVREYYRGATLAHPSLRHVVTEFAVPLFVLVLVSLLALAAMPKKPLGWAGLLCAGGNLYTLFTIHPYTHYYIIVGPLAALCGAMCGALWMEKGKGRLHRAAALGAIVLAAGMGLNQCRLLPGWKEDRFFKQYPAETLDYNNVARSMAAVIPPEEWDQVLAYGVDAQWYLATGIQPCLPLFIHQDWQSLHDPAMQAALKEMITQTPPKWLVLAENAADWMKDFTTQNYTVVSGEQVYTDFTGYALYRRNE